MTSGGKVSPQAHDQLSADPIYQLTCCSSDLIALTIRQLSHLVSRIFS